MNLYKGEKSLLCFSARASRWGGVYAVETLKCLPGHFLKSALDATEIETARGSDTQVDMSAMSLSKAIKCVYYKEPLTRMSQSVYYSSNWTYGMRGRPAPSSGDNTALLPRYRKSYKHWYCANHILVLLRLFLGLLVRMMHIFQSPHPLKTRQWWSPFSPTKNKMYNILS